MLAAFGAQPSGLRLERMQASPLWAGTRFENIHPILPNLRDPNTPWPSLREFFFSENGRFPTKALPSLSPLESWSRKADTGLRLTWLGHSTVLIEMDGYCVLTDPMWSTRAFPVQFAGPRRFQSVPVKLAQLPRIDVVTISHDHYDHLDYPTIRQLRMLDVPFVTSLGVGAHLEKWGVRPDRIQELDWWESFSLPNAELIITAAPSQHFSGRRYKEPNPTLWSSLVIRSPRHAVFFSGDTGLTTEYRTIRERLGPFDVSMLEIGAYYPAWGDIHLGPDNALIAHAMLGGLLMPIHWGTFCLGMHAWDQPPERLFELAPRYGTRLLMPRLGEAVQPARAVEVAAWWREVEVGKRRSIGKEEVDVVVEKTMDWPMD